ncbi:ubiquitin-like protein smt3 [Stylonychia lemnae]|uniref:Ubiquitin-like protein smt3 n=1 Tax=Stylonychia lemnae TaxID=5949 RepID=A0A078B9T5_STYLE|nr:ubiquitin-like protein smt3 [Stylonychia lemnae]|eukprot:CDW91189.1 ubiquitin-like protein smt3 [Stylonychia lemnae]
MVNETLLSKSQLTNQLIIQLVNKLQYQAFSKSAVPIKMEGNNTANTGATGDKPAGADPHINIKVKAQDGTEIFFKIKRTTQLKKLMDAYCTRQGLAVNQCRFIFDGERLKDDDTPDKLEMENGDEIDVMVEQTGGFSIQANLQS